MKLSHIPVILATLSSVYAADSEVCTLPPSPANGKYEVVVQKDPKEANATDYMSLNYTCNYGYDIVGDKTRICIKGIWTKELKCVRHCKLTKNPSVEYTCFNTGSLKTRDCKDFELNGSVIQPKCREPNYYAFGALMPHMNCIDGSWDFNPVCLPADSCFDPNGVEGLCIAIEDCATAVDIIEQRVKSTICRFEGKDPIICCPRKDTRLKIKETCKPHTERRPDMKVGKTAFHKCIEYQEQLKFPCEREVQPSKSSEEYFYEDYGNGDLTRIEAYRIDTCTADTYEVGDLDVADLLAEGVDATRGQFPHMEKLKFPCRSESYLPLAVANVPAVRYYRGDACSDPPPLVVGSEGIDASRGQFPHMALLGYGKELKKAQWLCGGTIISERFILTAGHCTLHRTLGPVTFARLGILKRSDPEKVVRDYGIKRFIQHPEYKPPSKYNDIALLETDKRIAFVNKHIVPACLDVGDAPPESEAEVASATGWGALGEGRGEADVLQIMEITRFSAEECFQQYGPHRLLKAGFDNATQICYGHREIPRDTCTGDSGGPLQVEYSGVECMHKVIGVTSFGRACGYTGQPGVYTRVRPYVPWVEAVVWPRDDQYVFTT